MTMPMDRIGQSLWTRAAPPYGEIAPLNGEIRSHVVVIGGGVVGMSAALHLAEAKCGVVVLDAGQDDGRRSASLASGGLIAPQLVRGTPASLSKGDASGERFVRLVAGAGRYTFDMIARHGLDCDASPTGFLAPFTEAQAGACANVVKEWAPFRDDVELLNADEAARLSGCQGYAGAVLDRSGGALNPLSFARAMGQRAAALGAVIHRATPALAITARGRQYVVTTPTGAVVADRVILAANGGNMALMPQLARTLLPLAVREVATAPLSPEMRQRILPEGHAMTDRGPDIFTIRFDAAGRLVTAATMPWGRTPSALTRAVNARLRRRIPDWQDLPLDDAWTGTAWLSADIQARYVPLGAGIIAVQACNGRGIALAGPIGRDLSDWVNRQDHKLALPTATPRPIAFYPLARRLPNFALGMAAIKGRFDL